MSGSDAGRQYRVTVSIGAALTRPADGDRPADELWRLVDRADAAMYEAKQQGRDRVVVPGVPRARRPVGDELPLATGDAVR